MARSDRDDQAEKKIRWDEPPASAGGFSSPSCNIYASNV